MSTTKLISDAEFDTARRRLSLIVEAQADAAAACLGFGWVTSAEAPETAVELRRAFQRSAETAQPLPIRAGDNDTTIYGSDTTNCCFRFWHDVVHVRRDLGFGADDELLVAAAQLGAVLALGHSPLDLEYRLLHADTVGQTLLLARTGCFALDQRRFVRECLELGYCAAIAREQARQVAP